VGADELFPERVRRRLLGANQREGKGKNGQKGEENAIGIHHLRQKSPEQPDYSSRA
jgi:hypothetical protein